MFANEVSSLSPTFNHTLSRAGIPWLGANVHPSIWASVRAKAVMCQSGRGLPHSKSCRKPRSMPSTAKRFGVRQSPAALGKGASLVSGCATLANFHRPSGAPQHRICERAFLFILHFQSHLAPSRNALVGSECSPANLGVSACKSSHVPKRQRTAALQKLPQTTIHAVKREAFWSAFQA